jgi:hypothetical protein
MKAAPPSVRRYSRRFVSFSSVSETGAGIFGGAVIVGLSSGAAPRPAPVVEHRAGHRDHVRLAARHDVPWLSRLA